MTLDNENLQAPLILAHKQEYRRLNSDLSFVKDLFGRFLDSIPTMFIVIDGLDEILQPERRQILRTTLDILQMRSGVKVLISSRPEDDISNIISKDVQPLRVHDCNHYDIEAYVRSRAASLVSNASIAESGLEQEISNLMKEIAAKAEGDYIHVYLAPRSSRPHTPRGQALFSCTAFVRLGLTPISSTPDSFHPFHPLP